MGNIIEQLTDDEFLYLQPWFYNNELALRCELGIGEDDYMENAFSRAIQIANILFSTLKASVVSSKGKSSVAFSLLRQYMRASSIFMAVCFYHSG